ncbi:hypothetical protein SAMN05421776_103347 [Nocardia farcinica]|uniref:Uncharacterized protein n=1 Tax=Nocardia farcinica TaxID=37329 RepID=A0A0H5P1E0_NOCFR|nr:hypothetical protein [Nocardia farcinica]AXK87165.1 hypothetical protein DXT66_17400 [Nocardia farcinica]CRY81114.1 Uncharacterised protein [Nocardia farcinica]SIT11175.1 hypothetical protein SAMN05421776_103347 [Nocardia farcinica]
MPTHRPAQVARYTAIVVAGAASLTLTVASGAYIVGQMSVDGSRTESNHAPAAPDSRASGPAPSFPDVTTVEPVAVERPRPTYQAAVFPADAPIPPVVAIPGAAAAPVVNPASANESSGLGGRLGLAGAYVDAQVRPSDPGTIAVTVDTNVVATLLDVLAEPGATAGTTRLSTEIDTRRGEIAVAFSDPALGEHTMEFQRGRTPSRPVDAPAAVASPAVASPAVASPADARMAAEARDSDATTAPTTVGADHTFGPEHTVGPDHTVA